MDTDEFTETVRREADLDTEAEAERAVEAALAVLGDRVTDGEAEDLAARLPDGPAGTLHDAATDEASSFDAEEFADRVADRLDRNRNEVWPLTRAVGAAVRESAPDEFERARDQLPDGYDRAFDPGETVDADAFRDRVRDELGDGEVDVVALIDATLHTLGERLSGRKAADLATYLPTPIDDAPTPGAEGDPEAFPPEEFVDRVADRTDSDEETAREGIRAVGRVLAAALGDREARKVGQQLPDEYGSLFPFASE